MSTKDLRWVYEELGQLQKQAPLGFGNSVRELRAKVKNRIDELPDASSGA